jgi:hypothetical protein
MRSNFRAHYYTSLGFQGAELKSSLELMLKDNVVGPYAHRPHSIIC